MKKILAIAAIAIRSAIRSRVVVCLFVILAVIILGLPATVKGDGTLAGYVRILLSYTLGLATFILALATLWAGCAAISAEVDGRQIQMVVAKPVHRLQIWLGKWLGLVAINSVMLTACGSATYGLLFWQAQHKSPADAQRLHEDVLVSRRVVMPEPINVDSQAEALLQARISNGELPANIATADALKAIRRSLLAETYTASPGSKLAWSFKLPSDTGDITLRYRLAASMIDAVKVTGLWMAGDFRQETTAAPGAWQELKIPNAPGGALEVEFANTDEKGVTVLFSPDDGLQALMPAGTFEANFVRSLLVIWAQLAFLAALGVTAGGLFSMPVAAFVSLYFMASLQAADYVSDLSQQDIVIPWHQSAGGQPGFADTALRTLFKSLSFVLAPLRSADPLGALAEGQLVSWAWVGHDAMVKVLIYGTILALAGSFVFNRRELALPS